MTKRGAIRSPRVDDDAIATLDHAHAAAAEARADLPPLLADVATTWLRDEMVSALASIRPTWFAGAHPPLFPTPRAYLAADQRARIAGVRAALWHVEARGLHHVHGSRPLVEPATPFVLNALAEGRRDVDPPSDPGLIRAADSRWNVRDHPYHHPAADECQDLIDATLEQLPSMSDQHPVVQGAWLAFSWISIHPFVDGNGRTARLLYLLVSSPAMPDQVDLGISEQWVFRRHHYLEALGAGQKVASGFDVTLMDPDPFTHATMEWSTAGAVLRRDRLSALARMWDALDPLPDPARSAAIAIALRTLGTPDDLPEAIGGYADRLETLTSLEGLSIVRRTTCPPSRATPGAPPRPHYGVTQQVVERLRTSLAQA